MVTGAGSTLGQEGPGTTLPPNYSAGFFSSDDNLKPSPADSVSTLSDTHQTSADTSGYSDNFFSSDGNIKPSPTSASNSISTVSWQCPAFIQILKITSFLIMNLSIRITFRFLSPTEMLAIHTYHQLETPKMLNKVLKIPTSPRAKILKSQGPQVARHKKAPVPMVLRRLPQMGTAPLQALWLPQPEEQLCKSPLTSSTSLCNPVTL